MQRISCDVTTWLVRDESGRLVDESGAWFEHMAGLMDWTDQVHLSLTNLPTSFAPASNCSIIYLKLHLVIESRRNSCSNVHLHSIDQRGQDTVTLCVSPTLALDTQGQDNLSLVRPKEVSLKRYA